MFTPSAPQHTAATGILTVSGSTFSRNTAGSIGSGGGGADLWSLRFAAPGGIGTGSATIGTSTFSNNQAWNPGNGGGILVESLATTVATTSFTNNSAGNRGGGIFVGGASLLLNGTTPSITFTGNTATNGGSSVSTSSAVNVDGHEYHHRRRYRDQHLAAPGPTTPAARWRPRTWWSPAAPLT